MARVARRAAAVWLVWLVAASMSLAVAAPDFPKLTGRVVDHADMLSPAVESELTRMLAGLEQANGDQVVVATLPDLQGQAIETYGYQLGRAWGIGDKDNDNGALLIVAEKERAIRIEVGYGLEGQLTDAKSSVIVNRIIEPAFKNGQFDAGVLQGTAAIVQLLGGQPPSELAAKASNAMQQSERGDGPSLGHTLMFFVLMVAIIALFGGGGGGGRGGRRRRRGGMPWIVPIGGGFGGGFGGGGFSGGGGSFGGGGASGGW